MICLISIVICIVMSIFFPPNWGATTFIELGYDLFFVLFVFWTGWLIYAYLSIINDAYNNYKEVNNEASGRYNFENIINFYNLNEDAYSISFYNDTLKISRGKHHLGYKSFLDYIGCYNYFSKRNENIEKEQEIKKECERTEDFIGLVQKDIDNIRKQSNEEIKKSSEIFLKRGK